MPKRKLRIKRRKYFGTKEKPRLSVGRTSNHIYAQVINDVEGTTLASASSLKLKAKANVATAKAVGKEIAKAAVAAGVKTIVFDKGKLKYHGRVKALADAAREGGLQF